MLLFITNTTPHAITFQNPFQYISCCYLSLENVNTLLFDTEFQYISCCYLSNAIGQAYAQIACFNTSHVVIYPLFYRVERRGQRSFNTSHVVIYLYICRYKSQFRKGFNTSHVVIYPTVLKHFFFSLFPFIPYFKAFSEILPAFFHFYIFLFIIAQPLVFTGFFRYFQFFQPVKFLQTNTYTLHLQFILSV